jgi:MoxR-like ATPase
MDAQIRGTLEALALTDAERAVAADLLQAIAASIERHLTPTALAALASRGVTADQAIEFLARRALEAVIEDGKRRAV